MNDEIENQVKEMLQKGLIQQTKSAFYSPVLLVKKKDKTCRFCVDYRHLNAMTVKYKYMVPIIDELLDELHGSCWFLVWILELASIRFCFSLVKSSKQPS
jgi:hypothetical protein